MRRTTLVLPIFWTVVTAVLGVLCGAGALFSLFDSWTTIMIGVAAVAAAGNTIMKWIGYIENR